MLVFPNGKLNFFFFFVICHAVMLFIIKLCYPRIWRMCLNLNSVSPMIKSSYLQDFKKPRNSYSKRLEMERWFCSCYHATSVIVLWYIVHQRDCFVIIDDCPSLSLSCNISAHHDNDFLLQSPWEPLVKIQGHLSMASWITQQALR